MNLQEEARQNVQDILSRNYHLSPDRFVLVLYDQRCTLSQMMTKAYTSGITLNPHSIIDIDTVPEETVTAQLNSLPAHSLVILIQSTSFRMTSHRLRADLFRAGHMVIEHARLSYNAEEQIPYYIASLKYDTPYYVTASSAIEKLLRQNTSLRIESVLSTGVSPAVYRDVNFDGKAQGQKQATKLRFQKTDSFLITDPSKASMPPACDRERSVFSDSAPDAVLEVRSPFEDPIKNTGDFSNTKIISAGFPIGEVFTEAKNLSAMNGTLVVFGFPTQQHRTHFTDPFTVTIKDGYLASHTGPAEFQEIVELISKEEVNHAVQVREIGFGLNRNIGFKQRLNEPTAFERFAGMHFSLGLKHAMYGKKLGRKIFQKYHIDIFCLVENVFIGDTQIMKKGKYVLSDDNEN